MIFFVGLFAGSSKILDSICKPAKTQHEGLNVQTNVCCQQLKIYLFFLPVTSSLEAERTFLPGKDSSFEALSFSWTLTEAGQ